jgi:metal-responsive CopG/Arc/MetJ family transcriptional regulator
MKEFKSSFTITMDSSLLQKVVEEAEKEGVNRSLLINRIVKKYFEEKEKCQKEKRQVKQGKL